jgi:putative FmdB family regulatory protein
MPIFEYLCKDCGASSEHLVMGNEAEAILCKQCGSALVDKVLSTSTILSHIPHRAPGKTCCGREERCTTPACSSGESCCKS